MTAPRMPGHTCPMIDKLKRRIEAAYKAASKGADTEDELRTVLAEVAHELHGEADALEDIRDANLGLRNCAEYWQAEAERLETATH